jgi:hypothetical protein
MTATTGRGFGFATNGRGYVCWDLFGSGDWNYHQLS